MALENFRMLLASRSGLSSGLPNLTTDRNAVVLAATTAENMTIPTGAKSVIFFPSNPAITFWVRANGTAAIPSGDVVDGSASVPNPIGLRLDVPTAVTQLSLIAAEAMTVVGVFHK